MSEATDEPRGWQSVRELAPSEMRAEEPTLARWIGGGGIMILVVGIVALYANVYLGRSTLVGPGLAMFFVVLGIPGLLYHAACDPELQMRRMYLTFGFMWLTAGTVLALVPYKQEIGGLFLPYGLMGLTMGLLFLTAPARHEVERPWHDTITFLLGGLGAVMAGAGFVLSHYSLDLMLPRGLLFIVLGLAYLWACVGLRGGDDPIGYKAGLGLGVIGALALAVALVRSSLDPQRFLMPTGLLLMGFGLVYVMVAAGICSDLRLVVMTRRELAGFFFSPIAYIVFFGLSVLAWLFFGGFVHTFLWQEGGIRGLGSPTPVTEPIIQYYIIDWFPIISVIFIVPVLTMRLFSEEHRTGTLEVMLTAPLDETALVLSKFLAAFLFFMLIWMPWGLFLVSLRVEGGQPFDYRPLLGFYVALAFAGASFLSMGLFFSSLTKNQVAAAVLTFVGMLLLTYTYFAKLRMPAEDVRAIVLTHISYLDLWINAVRGKLAVRDLLFHLSATVFWLFLTVKVLESRKWR